MLQNVSFVLLLLSLTFLSGAPALACNGIFQDQSLNAERFQAWAEAAQAAAPGKFRFFRGLNELAELYKSSFFGQFDAFLLKIPTRSGSISLVIRAHQLLSTLKPAADGDVFRNHASHLQLAANGLHLSLPASYFQRLAPEAPLEAVLLTPEVLKILPDLAELGSREHYAFVKSELLPLMKAHLEAAKALEWNGRPSIVESFLEKLRIARFYSKPLDQVMSVFPEESVAALREKTKDTAPLQVNATLVFLREINEFMGNYPPALRMIESLQREWIQQRFSEYTEEVHGEMPMQKAFRVGDGGAFFLTAPKGRDFSQDILVNGAKTRLRALYGFETRVTGRQGQKMKLQVEPPTEYYGTELWPVRVVFEP